MKSTKLYSLTGKDVVKGLLMAVMTAIATGLIEILNGICLTPPVYPSLQTFIHLLLAGITTGLIYIIKNFLTNSQDQFLIKEPIDKSSEVTPPSTPK